MNEAALISSTSAINDFANRARAVGRIGLDTEFLREKTFRARMCLVQLAADGEIVLIDPLDGGDLSPVADLVSDDRVQVIVHAGRQDFELFLERYGAVPASVFDVQIAAGFAGVGASLPYGRLIYETLGVSLEKGESYTDWCKRPLTEAQLSYAADDVRYLMQVADRLTDRLEEAGRLRWAVEEMRVLERAELYAVDPDEAWRRVSGRGTLSGRQMAVLRTLARWREEVAAARDVPRGWVIKDATLVELARKMPQTVPELKAIRGIHPREVERSARVLLDAVVQGRGAPAIQSAPTLPRAVATRARMLSGLADAIVRARCEKQAIAPELVSSRSDLEILLADVLAGGPEEGRHRLLQGWRRDLVGLAVVDLARGRIAVRVTDKPPYIEEVAVH